MISSWDKNELLLDIFATFYPFNHHGSAASANTSESSTGLGVVLERHPAWPIVVSVLRPDHVRCLRARLTKRDSPERPLPADVTESLPTRGAGHDQQSRVGKAYRQAE
jgi:hypothetical protein